LTGTYGLGLEINKHYFEISIFVNRYWNWFKTDENYDALWREKWRLIVYEITKILGGDYVLYFPDNAFELSAYLPCNFYFPKDIEKHYNTEIKDLDQFVYFISEKYSKPLALAEADKIFVEKYENNECPFVVDKFEDLDKTLKI